MLSTRHVEHVNEELSDFVIIRFRRYKYIFLEKKNIRNLNSYLGKKDPNFQGLSIV